MDILFIIIKYIGVTGVLIVILGIFGYVVIWSLSNRLEQDDTPEDDPDPPPDSLNSEVVKTPDTFKASGVLFFIYLFNCFNLYFSEWLSVSIFFEVSTF